MIKKKSNLTVDQVIESFPEALRPIAIAARAFVRSLFPRHIESVKWGWPCYMDAVSGEKIYSIIAGSQHIDLSLFHGAELPDPNGLLEGTGRFMRHIRLRTVEDLTRRGIKTLFREAIKLAQRT